MMMEKNVSYMYTVSLLSVRVIMIAYIVKCLLNAYEIINTK